jgi:hypothetical protein
MKVVYTFKYKKNTGRLFSSENIMALYLFGIDIRDQQGQQLPLSTYEYYIGVAQKYIEDRYIIKFQKQVIAESMDLWSEDYGEFKPIQTEYPHVYGFVLEGQLGHIQQITYPPEWISSRYSNQDSFFRSIFLVPNNGAAKTNAVIYSGMIPTMYALGHRMIPNYWRTAYVTSFKNDLPLDIIDIVGKFASIPLLNIAGDLALGLPGLASTSLSIDGLSQSLSTTASATSSAYSARVKQYIEEIKDADKKLKSRYKGFTMTAL